MEEKWIMYPKCSKNSGSIEAGCLQEILRKGSGGFWRSFHFRKCDLW
ncbi:hypothetical protein [Proteiniclasticum ruminis]|nr:hypothetical protein [Proteiniclasticum ruminis]